MKKIFTLALPLALSAGCFAEEKTKNPANVSDKETKRVTCYSGSSVTYEHDRVILDAYISDRDISARFREVDTGITVRVPISQCYFKDN